MGDRQGQGEAKYHSPGKGQIREAMAELWVIWQRAGVMASWAQPWEKVGIPREKAAERDSWSPSRRGAKAAGNRAANVLPGCCLLPRPQWSPSSCCRSGASGHLPTDYVLFPFGLHQRVNGREGWRRLDVKISQWLNPGRHSPSHVSPCPPSIHLGGFQNTVVEKDDNTRWYETLNVLAHVLQAEMGTFPMEFLVQSLLCRRNRRRPYNQLLSDDSVSIW